MKNLSKCVTVELGNVAVGAKLLIGCDKPGRPGYKAHAWTVQAAHKPEREGMKFVLELSRGAATSRIASRDASFPLCLYV